MGPRHRRGEGHDQADELDLTMVLGALHGAKLNRSRRNKYLLFREDSPTCQNCLIVEETVSHFLGKSIRKILGPQLFSEMKSDVSVGTNEFLHQTDWSPQR